MTQILLHFASICRINTATAKSLPGDLGHFALRAEFPGFHTRRDLEMINDK